MPSPAWLKELYDYVRSLEVINTPTIQATHRDRGTELHAVGGRGAGDGDAEPIEIREWTEGLATDRQAGELWCRTYFNQDTLPNGVDANTAPLTDAVDDGRMLGIWEALEDIPAGEDDEGPSLDNPLWRQIAAISTEKYVMRKDLSEEDEEEGTTQGRITLNVGRKPHVHVSNSDPDKTAKDAENEAYEPHVELELLEGNLEEETVAAAFSINLKDIQGLHMRPREVSICYQGQRWYCVIMMSQLYQTARGGSALSPTSE